MRIRKIDTTNRRDVTSFINYPFGLYADCEQWVPPLVSGVRDSLDRRNYLFYRNSTADFFVAENEQGALLGRIAVLDHRPYNEYRQSQTAFFYYFDLVDDSQVAHALLEAASGWARARGLHKIIGPKGLLRADASGILVEGFEYLATPGSLYNYSYYGELLAEAGFTKVMDYLSGYLEAPYELPERIYRIAERAKQRNGFSIKNFSSKRELLAWVSEIRQVNNAAFADVWGYYPLGDAEAQLVGEQLMALSEPQLIKLVLKDGEIAGFVLVFPDVALALRKAKGRLWPWGWFHLWRAFKTTRRLLGNGIGLLPQYQGVGANAVLYTELMKTVQTRGADFLETAYIAESNAKSLGDMSALNVNWYKRYRIFQKAL